MKSARKATEPKLAHPGRLAGKCAATTRRGSPCPATPLHGTDRCALHTPGRAASMGRCGGARRRAFDLTRLEKFAPPECAADMRKLLAAMVIEMREGKIDPSLASKVAFVAGIFLKSSELEEIKTVRAELEELKRRVLGGEAK